MHLTQTFDRVAFPVEIIEQGVAALDPTEPGPGSLDWFTILRGSQYWRLDTLDEWYGEYGRGCDSAVLFVNRLNQSLRVDLNTGMSRTEITVEAPDRPTVERLMRVFSSAASRYEEPLPDPEPETAIKPRIFIGHGGQNIDWRILKDELRDKHGYEVETYETGARSGNHIRDILDSMLDRSSFALLIMTAEDETADGDWRARQNVVHEAGLFQGRLGFNRAIAVVEDSVDVFSNLDGVQHIPYTKGQVKSTISDVLATIRREYPEHV